MAPDILLVEGEASKKEGWLMLLPDGVAMGMRNCSEMRLANLAAGRRPLLGRPGPRWSTWLGNWSAESSTTWSAPVARPEN
jgi:hypothetical protein